MDVERLRRVADFVDSNATGEALEAILPNAHRQNLESIQRHCLFSHGGLLVFPHEIETAIGDLRAQGLRVTSLSPSLVVRDRLRERYGLEGQVVDIQIARMPLSDTDRARELELFLLPMSSAGGLADVLKHSDVPELERAHEHETHFGFEVLEPDEVVLTGLRKTLVDECEMTGDGGGFNAHEGVSVFYFRSGNGSQSEPRMRLELRAAGEFRESLSTHLHTASRAPRLVAHSPGVSVVKRADPDASTRALLQLMIGAWATQAVYVAARLRIADHIGDGAKSATELAALTEAHPGSLFRLLRYLTSLGILREVDASFALTDLGQPLRTEADSSLHYLALIYGDFFYRSFGALEYGVRTGKNAFTYEFGQPPFDYFADHPEQARTFDRAMAAMSAFFASVPKVFDFSSARLVVDVGGGIGELLAQILTAQPDLQGLLFERPHVVAAARESLRDRGCLERCRLVEGDFVDGVPPGGDVYLLSRILHDWPDDRCRAILQNCRSSIDANGSLLVIERPVPEDGSPSLATSWDLHMMVNNVGGRERTLSEYRSLLGEAGFELQDRRPLSLDLEVLVARPIST